MRGLVLGLFCLIALYLVGANAEEPFGKESTKLKVEIVDHDSEGRILTLEITNSDSAPYVLTNGDGTDELSPRLQQPKYWFVFRHSHPNIDWFYEDARKGSWDEAKGKVTLEPGEVRKFTYFLVSFRKHIDYWFYDSERELRFKITNQIQKKGE